MARTEFNVIVLGEAFVGKSTLLTKLTNPSHEVVPNESDEYAYWGSQERPTATFKDFSLNNGKDNVRLILSEVAGSKGRMSNYFEIMTAAKQADFVVFCFVPDNEWSLNSHERTMNLVQRGRQAPNEEPTENRRASIFKKRSKKNNNGANAKKTDSDPLPSFLVQTKSDKADSGFADKYAKERNLPLYKVSALRDENVQSAFESMAQEMLAIHQGKEEEMKKKREQERIEQEKKEEEEKKKAAAANNNASGKNEFTGIWNKLMGKFVGKSKQQQQQQNADGQEKVIV